MLLITSADPADPRNESGERLGRLIPFFQDWLVLLYGLVAIALWHAPIYGWLLLVSGWARRATFLWAVLPLIAIQIFEKITFDTSHFGSLSRHRVMGFAPQRFRTSTRTGLPRSTRWHN